MYRVIMANGKEAAVGDLDTLRELANSGAIHAGSPIHDVKGKRDFLAGEHPFLKGIVKPDPTPPLPSPAASPAPLSTLTPPADPVLRKKYERQANAFLIVVCGLFGTLIFGSVMCFRSACAPPTPEEIAKRQQAAQNLEDRVRSLVANMGEAGSSLRWETEGHNEVRLTFNGPISEYEAQRLANLFCQQMPEWVRVEVYDNAGIKRASAMR